MSASVETAPKAGPSTRDRIAPPATRASPPFAPRERNWARDVPLIFILLRFVPAVASCPSFAAAGDPVRRRGGTPGTARPGTRPAEPEAGGRRIVKEMGGVGLLVSPR